MLILLLRRLSPRSRTVAGLVLVAAGLVLVAISAAVAAGLLIHGVALTVIGVVLYTSAVVSRRRARLVPRPGIGSEVTAAEMMMAGEAVTGRRRRAWRHRRLTRPGALPASVRGRWQSACCPRICRRQAWLAQ